MIYMRVQNFQLFVEVKRCSVSRAVESELKIRTQTHVDSTKLSYFYDEKSYSGIK